MMAVLSLFMYVLVCIIIVEQGNLFFSPAGYMAV